MFDFKHFKIRQFKRGDRVAPNKPLLLLLALSRLQRGEPRLLTYQEIEGDLKELILKYSKSSGTPHPEYPFWRLRNDMDGHLWEIPAEDGVQQNGSGDVRPADLIIRQIRGGFTAEVYHQLSEDKDQCASFAQGILDEYFPDSLHEQIREDIGLLTSWYQTSVRRKRDPAFARRVLEAYRYACSICQYGARLGHAPIGIEAAHIKWHAYNGPDDPANGLALCSLHHKAFDCGALGLSDEAVIVVSKALNGSGPLQEIFYRFDGHPLIKPNTPESAPSLEYLRWHRREVFRG